MEMPTKTAKQSLVLGVNQDALNDGRHHGSSSCDVPKTQRPLEV